MSGAGLALSAAVFCAGAAVRLAAAGRGETRRRARALLGGGGGEHRPEGWRERLPGEGARKRWSRRAAEEGAVSRRIPGGPGGPGGLGREVWCLPAGLVLGVLGESVLPLLASPVAGYVVRRRLADRAAERARDRRTAAVIRLCAAVAGELRAGRQPAQALLATGAPDLGTAGVALMAAARYGGDVPGALRAAARLPGAAGLTGVAACWQVAVEGGAGLASGLERIAAGLRARRDQREDLKAQLAGPRATALMLALLPAGGLLMGGALGAAPLRVLLHTPVGWVCLVTGGLLEWGGMVWTARIVAQAEGAEGAEGTEGAGAA